MSDAAADILAIMTVSARLAQAADDRDEAAYAACLAPTVDGPDGRDISAADYARASIGRVATMDWTHHRLVNPIVTIEDERASACIDVVIDMARRDPAGTERHATMGGRYNLGFRRLDGEWRIDRRTLHRRYSKGDIDLIN
uniref:nuclear transport factor 2 family protein n=1 Tax=uncultured Sphingomonas sp. TaxID=158754 RepID=UPI0035C98B0E